ncbi:MAG: hypothetical protein RBT36_11685, partial [Desulfobulbus sp.]|nr:hypothetical protein [Desulfobulbus sp.]
MTLSASLLQNKRYVIVSLFLAVVASLLYHFLVENRAYVELNVQTDKRTIFKIYWKQAGGEWSEERMAANVVKPGHTAYSFRIGDLNRISALRIDPSERIATVLIRSLVITQRGFPPIRIDTKEAFEQLRPLAGIRELTLDDQGLSIVPANKDPWLGYDLPTLTRQS